MQIPKELELDWQKTVAYGVNWIKDYFKHAKSKTAIIGLSGGSDSTITACLTAKALGSKNVIGVLMPEDGITTSEDILHAEDLVRALNITRKYINITPIINQFINTDSDLLKPENKITYANLKPRIRMILLYKEANKHKGLVVGTDDRSENILGYFTKYGDGGVDINVPEYLYKTQVRKLLDYIAQKENIPVFKQVAEKKPSPRLWANHTAEEEMNLEYKTVDTVLFYLKDHKKKLTDSQIAKLLKIDMKIIREIKQREATNSHKNKIPPSPHVNYSLWFNR